MTPFRRKALPLFFTALWGGPVFAVGLGDIELQSFLGAPLQAVIPLNELGDLDADQLKIALANPADYEAMGVEFSFLHTQLRIEPVVANGRAYVRVNTRDPIAEPYLNFVLTLRWPNGQLNREYTLLLDPPPQPAAPATASREPAPATRPAVAAAPRPAPETAAPRSRPAPSADGRYYTRRGDSLWRLAERLRPASVPVARMMDALHRANPDAFVDNDPGRLKESVPIVVPGDAEIAAAASAPPQSRPAQAPAQTASALTPAAPPPAAAAEGEGRLELLPESDISQLSAENSALRDEVASLTAQVAGLNQSLAVSEQRMRQVEARLDGVLAQYDRQRPNDPASATPAGAAVKSGSPFADGASTAPGAAGPAASVAPVQPATVETGVPWWVHLGYWSAIAALVGWVLASRRRARKSEPLDLELALRERELETVGLTAAAPAAGEQWNNPAENQRYWQQRGNDETDELPLDLIVAAAEPPVPKSPRVEPEEPAVVDAAINAGVFLAFGRYDEAEQVLLTALEQEPDRTDLQLQLLDVYLHSDNRAAFERLAGELELNHDEPELLAELETLRGSFRAQ